MDSNTGPRRVLKPSGASSAAPEGARGAATAEAALADGQEQSPRQTLTKAVEDQLRLPKYRRLAGAQDAARLADAMMGCVNPPELDFTALSDEDAKVLAAFPPGMWATLRQLALAQSSCDITSVTLSAPLSAELVVSSRHTLAQGMVQLPGLTHLTIVDPPAGSIDLAQLGVMPASLANVQIRCPAGPKKWELHVPQGVEVSATASSVATEKSTVFYYDRDGQRSEPRTLGGVIYDHQAKNWTLPQTPRQVHLNGQAEYVGHDEADPEERKIWCRHLAVHWLRARLENRATDDPFDYGPFASAELLSAALKPGLEDDLERMAADGTDALFAPGHFGKLLAEQFGRMQDGQTRQYIVHTPEHALALELRVKKAKDENKAGAPIEYVVTLYDPNHTALHERLVVPNLDLLREKGLAAWMTPGAMAAYFPAKEGPPIGMLYSWTEEGRTKPEAPATDFIKHMPDQLKASSLVLFTALHECRTEAVGAVLDTAMELSLSGRLDRAGFEQCIAAKSVGIPGLAAAIAFGRTAAVHRYVGWILDAAPGVLSSAQRVKLLLASLEDGQPGLHLTASEEAAGKHATMIAESVSSYFRAIVASPNLSAQDKATLCAAAHHGRTAAQAALDNNNPMMAAAMVCAICEAENDPDARTVLLASLGVNPRGVLAAQSGTPYPRLADWVDIVERGT